MNAPNESRPQILLRGFSILWAFCMLSQITGLYMRDGIDLPMMALILFAAPIAVSVWAFTAGARLPFKSFWLIVSLLSWVAIFAFSAKVAIDLVYLGNQNEPNGQYFCTIKTVENFILVAGFYISYLYGAKLLPNMGD